MGLNGIDIASYQSGIQPAKLTTTDFIIVKFTQGTSYLNPYASTQYSLAKKAGKLLGAYHYAAGGDPIKEAQYFVKNLGDRKCVLALDWEGAQNPQFGKNDVDWCFRFLTEVYRLTGVRPLLYMSKSVARAHDWSKVANDYPLWCAQYGSNNTTGYQSNPWTDSSSFGAWRGDTIRQYSSKGRLKGYSGNLDLDKAYMTKSDWKKYAEGKSHIKYSRSVIVKEAKSLIGIKEGGSAFKKIINRYNAHTPLAMGYKVAYTDAWCAVFVSYVFIAVGYADLIPIECSCPRMIEKAKRMGIWVEDDAYTPKIGDIIMYDWQDNGKGDNTGTADHVGIVSAVSGAHMTIIEGNYKDSVGTRGMAVNGRFIRGYITPDYDETAAEKAENLSDDKPKYKQLQYGSKGKAVKVLQLILGGLTVDGEFYGSTEDRVKEYQKNNGLSVDGIVGDKTWTSIIGNLPLTKYGSKSRFVKAIQTALGGLTVDGDFGKKTLAKVKTLQKSAGITVDGEVGRDTWTAIISRL